jgi:hypothetical protein
MVVVMMDLWICPHEKVVEVRASGLLNGRLQFPSIRAVRSDKPVDFGRILHFPHFPELSWTRSTRYRTFSTSTRFADEFNAIIVGYFEHL